MMELREKAIAQTKKMAEELIVNKCLQTKNYRICRYKRGVKKWILYVCQSCHEISTMTEQESDGYLTRKADTWSTYYATCPKCGVTTEACDGANELGCVYTEVDQDNLVSVKCTVKSYPDVEILNECKLGELTAKDVYDFVSNVEEKYSKSVIDATNWDMVLKTFKANEEKDEVNAFLVDAGISTSSARYVLLSYLLIMDNPNICKVLSDVSSPEAVECIQRFFKNYVYGQCKYSDFTALKQVFKKLKDMTDEDVATGEVFTMPLEITKECDTLTKFNALRKLYGKAKSVEDFKQIMDGAAISDEPKYINALRGAINRTGFTSGHIANICIMQYMFGGHKFEKTCKLLASKKLNAHKYEFFKIDIHSANWCNTNNSWVFRRIETDNNFYAELTTKYSEIKPESEVIFEDEMYEVEKRVSTIKKIVENECIYFPAINELYDKNIAYMYTAGNKYLLARNNGDILLRGEFLAC